jgi:hypothetical protein
MTSRDYAVALREAADALDARPEFELPRYVGSNFRIENFYYYEDKDRFLAAMRALGAGTKTQDDNYGSPVLRFTIPNGRLSLSVSRDRVCRLVKPAQPAEYDCQPLLSPEESEQVGVPPAEPIVANMAGKPDIPF